MRSCWAASGCFHKFGVLVVGAPEIRGLVLGVCIRAPDFGNPHLGSSCYEVWTQFGGTAGTGKSLH